MWFVYILSTYAFASDEKVVKFYKNMKAFFEFISYSPISVCIENSRQFVWTRVLSALIMSNHNTSSVFKTMFNPVIGSFLKSFLEKSNQNCFHHKFTFWSLDLLYKQRSTLDQRKLLKFSFKLCKKFHSDFRENQTTNRKALLAEYFFASASVNRCMLKMINKIFCFLSSFLQHEL